MVKPDELMLMRAVLDHGTVWRGGICGTPARQNGETIRSIGEELGMHPKRLYAICLKWTDRGWWRVRRVGDARLGDEPGGT